MSKIQIDSRAVELLPDETKRVYHMVMEEIHEAGKGLQEEKGMPKISKLFCEIKTSSVFSNSPTIKYDNIKYAVNKIIKKINQLIDRIHKLEKEVEELRREKEHVDQ